MLAHPVEHHLKSLKCDEPSSGEQHGFWNRLGEDFHGN